MRSGKGRERSSERSGARRSGARKPGDLVLSSDAVLAVLTEGAGSKKVEAALAAPGTAYIDTVSLLEVLSGLTERGLARTEAEEALDALALRVENVDEDLARRAAEVLAEAHVDEVSFSRAFSLVLGQRLGVPTLTADAGLASADRVNIQGAKEVVGVIA